MMTASQKQQIEKQAAWSPSRWHKTS